MSEWNGIHLMGLMQVVAGGGVVEAALSVFLENLATTLGSREQLAIAEFAESLLVIPKVVGGLLLYTCCLFCGCHRILKAVGG